jgi:hypothetical protein
MNYTQQELPFEAVIGLDISAIDTFLKAANQQVGNTDTVQLYHEVITREEIKEYTDAYVIFAHYLEENKNYRNRIHPDFIIEYVDGCIDTIWCILCELRGLGLDPVALFNEVARSNLSKISDSGSIEKNAAGKVMKPLSYSAPNLVPLVMQSELVKELVWGKQIDSIRDEASS